MATMSDLEKVEKSRAKIEDGAFLYEDMSGSREREFPMLLGGDCTRSSSVETSH